MSTDTTTGRWFEARAAADAASATALPFPGLRLSVADETEAQAAGRFARSVQLAGQRIDAEVGFDIETQGGSNA